MSRCCASSDASIGKPLYAVLAARTRTRAVEACTTKNIMLPAPKTAEASCAITVGWGAVVQSPGNPTRSHVDSATWTWATMARAVIPTNMATARVPIAVNVRAALRALGGWKAGTPLLMASTPVRAVQPDENALRARKSSASPVRPVCWACTDQPALSATGASPMSARVRPTPLTVRMHATNTYDGTANARPDSLVPRRFIMVRPAITATAMATRCGLRLGTAEMTLSTPAATDTATVM